jgi:hypothetical protein
LRNAKPSGSRPAAFLFSFLFETVCDQGFQIGHPQYRLLKSRNNIGKEEA